MLAILVPFSGYGQGYDEVLDEYSVSYIYAAVMGSGTYKIDDRRIAMLRIPVSWTQQELTEDQPGIRWHLPIVLGYDSLNYPDWLSRLLDDDLVTLTVMPGFEVKQMLTERWEIKPFGHLGVGYDFTRDETILMGVLGIRGLGTWRYDDASELRLGTSIRYAAEYQTRSEDSSAFSLLEGGVDYRRDIRLPVFSKATNGGVYYLLQLFVPEWEISRDNPTLPTELGLIHEVGASIGFKEPRTFLGFSWSRVRTGFKFGRHVRGWTIGTDFPF